MKKLLTLAVAFTFLFSISAWSVQITESEIYVSDLQDDLSHLVSIARYKDSSMSFVWSGTNHLQRYVLISSVEELVELKELAPDFTHWDNFFQELLSTYAECFFEDSFLLFIDWFYPDISELSFDISSIQDNGNFIEIEVTENNVISAPLGVPLHWLVVIEMDLHILERGFSLTMLCDWYMRTTIVSPPPPCDECGKWNCCKDCDCGADCDCGYQKDNPICGCEYDECCDEDCVCGDDCECNEIQTHVAPPTATPANRTFTNNINVELETETIGAVIFFTTDGSEPTTASTPFTAPIRLTSTTTIRAIAVVDGMASSEELSVTFTRQTGGGGGGNFGVDTSPLNPNERDEPLQNGGVDYPADPQPWQNPFVDVNSNDWFYNYFRFAVQSSLMQGVSATEFAPNLPTTRAMFVTVLWRLAGSPIDWYIGGVPNAPMRSQFDDVAIGTWYHYPILWAERNSVILGVSETEFAPHVEITREQMAAVIYRGLDAFAPNVAVTQMYFIFEDADEISGFAKNGIQTLANMGVMQGNADGTFIPQGLATRAEVAAVMARLSER